MTVLPRRAIPQPLPQRNAGGDCEPCVLGGLLGVSVDTVYAELLAEEIRGVSWPKMREVLYAAQRAGRLDRVIDDVPLWPDRSASLECWGLPGWCQNLAWFRYVRMALDAGYYAIANVSHGKRGPFEAPDHWVLLVGTRERIEERHLESGAPYWTTHHELLVSCSSTTTPDEEWVLEHDFLRERGGFNALLARPA